jgi:hypothetical protein
LDSLEATHLRGGISADSVVAAMAAYEDAADDRGVLDVVVKELRGAARREMDIYPEPQSRPVAFAPRVLAFGRDAEVSILALERIAVAMAPPRVHHVELDALLLRGRRLGVPVLPSGGERRTHGDQGRAVPISARAFGSEAAQARRSATPQHRGRHRRAGRERDGPEGGAAQACQARRPEGGIRA